MNLINALTLLLVQKGQPIRLTGSVDGEKNAKNNVNNNLIELKHQIVFVHILRNKSLKGRSIPLKIYVYYYFLHRETTLTF